MFGKLLIQSAMIWFFVTGCGLQGGMSRLAGEESATKLRYPVVLHHGFLGFDRVFALDYFFGVKDTLEEQGIDVFVTRVAPVNTIAFRANQLAEQIDAILRETQADKVNVIAHSMGGLDTRYLISTLGYGDRIASLTSISTPHKGSPVADLAYRVVGGEGLKIRQAIEFLFLGNRAHQMDGFIADDIDLSSPVDIRGALGDLSVEYQTQVFNGANPDDPRVLYESYAAHSKLVGRSETPRIQPILLPFFLYMRTVTGDNDGLVSVESAQHGNFRGALAGDHMDVVGQLLGHSMNRFNHKEFYINLVDSLRSRGL